MNTDDKLIYVSLHLKAHLKCEYNASAQTCTNTNVPLT